MKTSQPHVARIEGGKVRPSTGALLPFARAIRMRLRIAFELQTVRERQVIWEVRKVEGQSHGIS